MIRVSLSSVIGGVAASLVAVVSACVDTAPALDAGAGPGMPAGGSGSSSGGAGSSGAPGSSGATVPRGSPDAGPDPCMDSQAGGGLTSAGYGWQNVAIHGGGFVTGIEFSPAQSDIIYARTDVGGAYRWDGTAQRWLAITDWVGRDNANLMGIESIAPDPADPSVVYIAAGEYLTTNGMILRSGDMGATWQSNSIPLQMGGNADGRNVGERLAIDPNLTSTLYFAARNTRTSSGAASSGLWTSNNSAAAWSQVSSFPTAGPTTYGLSFVLFDKRSGSAGTASSTIYVGVSPGAPPATGAPPAPTTPSLYRSTDAGATWLPVPGAPTGQYPHHAAMDYTAGALYLTYNDFSGPNSVTSGSVWKLDTSSDAWTNVSPPQGRGGFGGISVDPTRSGTVVVSTIDRWNPDAIYRTTTGGPPWTTLQASRDVAGAQYLYFGSSTTLTATGWMGDIEIDPHNPNRVLYNTGQGIWWTDDVSSTTTHWRFQDQGLEETVALGLISPSAGPHLLSAVGDIGGFRHDDLTQPPAIGMYNNPVFANTTGIDFAEQHPAIVVRVGTAGSGWKRGAYSTDGGASWTQFAMEANGSASAGSVAISADGATIVWAPQGTRATPAPPAYSVDFGGHWTAVMGLPNGARVASDRANPTKFYATSGTQLYVSTSGGVSFAAAGPLPAGGGTPRPTTGIDGDLWVAGNGGLAHSSDSGAHFDAPLGSVQNAAAVGFGRGAACSSYPVLYLAGQANHTSGVFRSDDQGVTWQRIDDPQHQFGSISYITGDPRLYGRVYLGSGGRGVLYGDPQ
jgi:hypothetical protein